LVLLKKLVELGLDGRRCWTLIVLLKGFWCTQTSAVVIFHLVPRNSHNPRLQGTGAPILAEALPCGEEDFLDEVLDLIVPRSKTGTNVAIESVGMTGDEVRRRLTIFAQHGRDQPGILDSLRGRCWRLTRGLLSQRMHLIVL
jgi:hypothetical protein